MEGAIDVVEGMEQQSHVFNAQQEVDKIDASTMFFRDASMLFGWRKGVHLSSMYRRPLNSFVEGMNRIPIPIERKHGRSDQPGTSCLVSIT